MNTTNFFAASGSLSPSDGERAGERGFELANIVPPLPPLPLSLLLHPMEEREKTRTVCERGEMKMNLQK